MIVFEDFSGALFWPFMKMSTNVYLGAHTAQKIILSQKTQTEIRLFSTF